MKRAVKDRGEFNKVKQSLTNLDIYELSETGNNILNLSLQYPEMTDTDIAKKLNLTKQWVSKIKNTPAYKRAQRESIYEARRIILENKTKAAEKLISLMDSETEKIVLDTVKTILGDVLDPKNVNLNITDLQKIKDEFKQIIGG